MKVTNTVAGHAFGALARLSVLCCLLVATHASYARPLTFKGGEISKAQMTQVEQVLSAMDKDLQRAFKSNPKLESKMKAELKSLMGKSPSKSAISSYQRKYQKDYSALLKSANVDLNRYAGQLRRIFPGVKFQVKNNAIYGKKVLRKSEKVPSESPSPKRITQFQDVKDAGCMGGAGGGVDFTNTSISNGAFAAAGICFNYGEKRALLNGQNVSSSSSLTMKADISVNIWAGALVGSSGAIAKANVGENSLYESCVAPIAWMCGSEASMTNAIQSVSGDDLMGVDAVVTGDTFTEPLGAASAAYGGAKVENLEVLFRP